MQHVPPPLLGRDQEIAAAAQLVGSAADGVGGALLIVGEPGLGKTALAGFAREVARDAGVTVLSCQGNRLTQDLGFAGLHELLHPVVDLLERLPDRQRSALGVAFGLDAGPPADPLVTGVATLGLLEEAGAAAPVLVVVEDLHWLDPSSAQVVGFLASRLRDTSLALLATTRPSPPYPDRAPSFPQHLRLEPLGEDDARRLVARTAPDLRPRVRDRVVAQAQGNPLALAELAAAADGGGDRSPAGGRSWEPSMSARIERVFLEDVATLPESARRAMELAAAGEDLGYRELLAAASDLGLPPSAFDPAERAGLLWIEGDRVVFRHPLVCSAVYESISTTARAQMHRALAAAARDPVAAVWHRATGTLGWDEQVAQELEDSAEDAARRGARREAARTWQRAAELSPDHEDRARRLAHGAELSRQAGMTDAAVSLITEAGRLPHDAATEHALARSQWLLQLTAGRVGRSPDDLLALAASSRASDRAEVLVWAATVCFVLQEPPDVHARVRQALAELAARPDDPLREVGLALVDPVAREVGDVAELIAGWSRRIDDASAPVISCLAFVAEERANLTVAQACWTTAVDLFHASGRVSDEAIALCGRASVHATLGLLDEAIEDAEQSLRLCGAVDLPVVAANAAAHLARACATRGEAERAEEALRTVAAFSGAEPVARVEACAAWATGLLAANDHRYADAVDALERTRANPPVALWAGADVVEPAVRTGREVEARTWLEAAEVSAQVTGSDHLGMLVERARALLAPDASAGDHFVRAIAHGTRTRAPLDLARTRLAYGEWLRRRRRVVDSRAQLEAALGGFTAHGARPWIERTVAELGAAGAPVAEVATEPTSSSTRLTTQEMHIARLAAQGLSNIEIADQVYLSRRTVGAHLHRAFAKLQVEQRGQLAEALGAQLSPAAEDPRGLR